MEGLTIAPLTPGDGPAVARVWRACEIHDDGEALFTEEDFAASCRRPSMDLRRDSIGVRDGGELVALALLHGERDAFAGVLRSHRGRGSPARRALDRLAHGRARALRARRHARDAHVVGIREAAAMMRRRRERSAPVAVMR